MCRAPGATAGQAQPRIPAPIVAQKRPQAAQLRLRSTLSGTDTSPRAQLTKGLALSRQSARGNFQPRTDFFVAVGRRRGLSSGRTGRKASELPGEDPAAPDRFGPRARFRSQAPSSRRDCRRLGRELRNGGRGGTGAETAGGRSPRHGAVLPVLRQRQRAADGAGGGQGPFRCVFRFHARGGGRAPRRVRRDDCAAGELTAPLPAAAVLIVACPRHRNRAGTHSQKFSIPCDCEAGNNADL